MLEELNSRRIQRRSVIREMTTYIFSPSTDSLRDDQKSSEEPSEDDVEEEESSTRLSPFSGGESDDFLLAGSLAGGNNGGQLALWELHVEKKI